MTRTLAIVAIMGLLLFALAYGGDHGKNNDYNDYDYDYNDDYNYDYNDEYSNKGKNKHCKNKHDDKDDCDYDRDDKDDYDNDYDYDYDYDNDDYDYDNYDNDDDNYGKHGKCKNRHDKDDKCNKKHDKDDDKCKKKHNNHDDKCKKKHDKCPSKRPSKKMCPTTDLSYIADQLITKFLNIFNDAVNESDPTLISSKYGPRLQEIATSNILVIVNNRYNSQYNYENLGDYVGDAGKFIDVSMRLLANREYNISKDCKRIVVRGLYHGAEHDRINTSCTGFWTIVAGTKEFTLVLVKGKWKIELVRIREVVVLDATPKLF